MPLLGEGGEEGEEEAHHHHQHSLYLLQDGHEGQIKSLYWEEEVRRERRQLNITNNMLLTYCRMDRTASRRAWVGRGR